MSRIACLYVAALLSFATAPSLDGADILFLGGSDPPGGGDPGAIDHLEGLGHTITYMIGDEAVDEDATGQDLVVISSTLLSSTVRGKFQETAEPILTWESSMVRAAEGEFWISDGQQSGDHGSFVTVLDASHPIMDGINVQDGDELEMFVEDQNFFGLTGEIAPGADLIAVGADPCCDEERSQIVSLPAGAESLMGEPSPGLRVSIPLSDTSFDFLSDDGLRLFDNAVNFALGLFDEAGPPALQAGDADQDLDFDQLDLVAVQVAAKYLSGQSATWGEGDWNGAPGGQQNEPPAGDGRFDQLDIIAALGHGLYLTGSYGALKPGGAAGDEQTSIGYDPTTGEVWVDAPANTQLTSINIDSAAGVFTREPAAGLGGSFDNDADGNIFKATFGGSFGSVSFGAVAQTGLSQEFILGDLTVVGSLAGGGALGDVDLLVIPEPSTMVLLAVALAWMSAWRRSSP